MWSIRTTTDLVPPRGRASKAPRLGAAMPAMPCVVPDYARSRVCSCAEDGIDHEIFFPSRHSGEMHHVRAREPTYEVAGVAQNRSRVGHRGPAYRGSLSRESPHRLSSHEAAGAVRRLEDRSAIDPVFSPDFFEKICRDGSNQDLVPRRGPGCTPTRDRDHPPAVLRAAVGGIRDVLLSLKCLSSKRGVATGGYPTEQRIPPCRSGMSAVISDTGVPYRSRRRDTAARSRSDEHC